MPSAESNSEMAPVGAASSQRKSGVQSLDRVLAILRSFSLEEPTLGVSEIARRIDLTSSTTHRLLTSLAQHGLVMRTEARGYALGPELLRLALVAKEAMDLRDIAEPIMVQLRDATDETVGLHVRDTSLLRHVIHQVESRQALRRIYTEMGQAVPLHQGAPGKVLLAYLSESEQNRVLSEPLEKATERTITNPASIRKELAKVRSSGYAISVQERVTGIASIAVPVWDYSDRVVAVLSVSGPASRMSEKRLHSIAPTIKAASHQLSILLGATPTT